MTSAEWPFAPEPGAAGTESSDRSASTIAAQLIVLAKAPVPGRVKTRLTPPFTPQEAAMLAEAALVEHAGGRVQRLVRPAHAVPG